MVSEEGLNAYGAVTWGQFFIYQGFNDKAGWMHTTSNVDDLDEYLETVVQKGDKYFYKYGNEERPMIAQKIVVPYKTAIGHGAEGIHRLPHASRSGDPQSRRQVGRDQDHAGADEGAHSSRTRGRRRRTTRNSGRRWSCTPTRRTTRSSPTPQGNIAYFHGNFIPKRDTRFDWTKPVDGSDPATEWKGLLRHRRDRRSC